MGRIEFEANGQAGRFASRAFFYPEAAAKSLRELFEDLHRGGLR